MGSSKEEEEYAAFLEKVKKTMYVDNLSPHVTETVMKAAFNQFGDVVSVQFIPNYLEPKNMAQSALVEMQCEKQAQDIIKEMAIFPFMISGMPRPVRARPAKLEMFEERPRNPRRKILCRWLDPKEPDFEVAKKIKQLVRKHGAEASLLLEHQLEEEEKLHNQQNEALKANYKKYELIDGVYEEGRKLADHYNMSLADA